MLDFRDIILQIYIVVLGLSLTRFFSAEYGIHNASLQLNISIVILFLVINSIILAFFYLIYRGEWGNYFIRYTLLTIIIFSPLVVYSFEKIYFPEQLCERPITNPVYTNFKDTSFVLPNPSEYQYDVSEEVQVNLVKVTKSICSPNSDLILFYSYMVLLLGVLALYSINILIDSLGD